MASKLGMTVAHLRATMDNGEYVRWHAYYARKAQRQELELSKAKGG